MEYESVLEKIGGFGKYQKILLILMCIPSIFNAMTTFMLNFIFGEHPHRCKIPGLDTDTYSSPGPILVNTSTQLNSYNVTECTLEVNGSMVACHNFVYDRSLYTSTIVSKFDVVCDDKFYRAHVLMAHYIGLLIGSIAGGFVMDIFGRKPILAVGIGTLFITTGIRPWIPSLAGIAIFEFFNGAGSMVSYNAPFILVTEMLASNKRLFGSFCVYIAYCVGNYILLILAYFIRDWNHLVWTISGLTALYLLVLCFITESPRWLISRGRGEEAIKILEKAAEINGNILDLSKKEIIVRDEQRTSFIRFVKAVVRSKTLMSRLSVISLNWFAVSLAYYGIGMNVAKFSGNVFGNFAASSSAETAAILFCWLVADRTGRKKLLSTAMIIGGVSCICTIFTTLYATESYGWITTTLAMIGKFCITVGFFVAYLFTAELFPTVLRSSAIGFASMTGRVGSILSAYIGELRSFYLLTKCLRQARLVHGYEGYLKRTSQFKRKVDTIKGAVIPTKFGVSLPLIVFGIVTLVAGLLSLTLPETYKITLPETVNNAKAIHSKNLGSSGLQTTMELEKLTQDKNI